MGTNKTALEDFRDWYPKTHHARLSKRPHDGNMNNWSRWELQEYLEERGFAVYDHETDDELREAAKLDMGCETSKATEGKRCLVEK